MTETAPLYFKKRGEYKNKTFWFSSRFPFGFTYRRAHVRLEEQVLVYPSIDPKPGFELLLSGDHGRLADPSARTRPRFLPHSTLVPDESSRHVDWRATAQPASCRSASMLGIRIRRSRYSSISIRATLNGSSALSIIARFLSGGLAERGVRLHFMTQRWAPEDSGVYDILKYLAVVEPHRGLKPSIPHEHTLQIALSTRPNELAEAGWMRARMVTPADLGANVDIGSSRPRWNR